MSQSMTISKLASAAQVNIETVRFYERKGIIKQPKKNGAFRYYSFQYMDQIHFIKRSQELGFSLKEAKELMDLKIKDQAKCADVLTHTYSKISEIEQKINDLKKMKKSLQNLAKCCVDIN